MNSASTCLAAVTTAPITPIFGAFIRGIDLNQDVSDTIIKQIQTLVRKYRLLIFKDQGIVSAERQLTASRWFGDIESTFYKHPKSPHPDIFRVSNDEAEGCCNVGRSGWHIDGSFQSQPFQIQTMHFWSVSQHGSTLFSPMREVVESLPQQQRDEWETLYFVGRGRQRVVHPLVYPHPATNETTMCFHCGEPFIEAFAVNFQPPDQAEQVYGWEATKAVLAEITQRLEDPERMYEHHWEMGDFAIIDNLAVAHYAHPDTQADPRLDGLRILHRTTVAGVSSPTK